MKRLRILILVVGMTVLLALVNCEEEDFVCAGCPVDSPWSAFDSESCYETYDLCSNYERGDCVICE